MLARLLAQARGEAIPRGGTAFRDVEEDAWYCDGVCWLAGEGILRGRGDDLFDPEAPLTVRELSAMVDRFLTACGGEALSWGDGPADAPVTRAETVAALDLAAGREPDRQWIDRHLSALNTFADVPPCHPYFYEIVAAANLYEPIM